LAGWKFETFPRICTIISATLTTPKLSIALSTTPWASALRNRRAGCECR
jgi:hypothetical protein